MARPLVANRNRQTPFSTNQQEPDDRRGSREPSRRLMGTRVRVGVVGQDTGFKLMRVDLTASEDAIRAELVSKAL